MQAHGALTWSMRSSDKPLGMIVKLESAKRPFESPSIVVSSMVGKRGCMSSERTARCLLSMRGSVHAARVRGGRERERAPWHVMCPTTAIH